MVNKIEVMDMNWNRYYKEQLSLGVVIITFFIGFIYGWIVEQWFPELLCGILTIICLYVWIYRMYSPAYDEDKKNLVVKSR